MSTGGGGGHDFVRPFIMTGGRTRAARRDLRLETMLQTTDPSRALDRPAEQRAIVELCREPQSVAEIGAKLGLVVGVASVLVGDLIEEGLLEVHHTDPVEIELDMLTRMIERVRAI
ncbi:MAG: DUF742 domain-containing protein [Acidimicrobiia bacterium]